MSEMCGLYFYKEMMTISDFSEVWIGDREVSGLIDSFDISLTKNRYTYGLMGIKDGKPVKLIQDYEIVTSIEYSNGYCPFNFNRKPYYKIAIRNFKMEEVICDLNSIKLKCSVCNSQIFPEPNNYCKHIAFIYVEEFKGLWVYAQKKIHKLINLESNQMDMDKIGRLCEENIWELRVYINEYENTHGLPKIFVGGRFHGI